MKVITRSILAALALSGGAGIAEEVKKADPASGQTKIEIGPVSVSVSVSSDVQGKKKKTPYLGVVAGTVSPELGAQLNLPEGMGVIVEAVPKDSPAEKSGIRKYDVLKKFNDQVLCVPEQLSFLVKAAGKDAKVTLVVLRGGKEQNVEVTLGEFEAPEAGKAQTFSVNGMPGISIDAQNLDKVLKEGLSGALNLIPHAGAGGGSGGIQDNFDQMKKRNEMRRKEIEAQAEAARKKAEEAGGRMKAQVFSVYPDAQTQSMVSVSDGDGTIEISDSNGKRSVKIKDASGKEIHSGPLNTEEDRNAVPEKFRSKVKDAESKIKTGSPGPTKKPSQMKKPEPAKESGQSI